MIRTRPRLPAHCGTSHEKSPSRPGLIAFPAETKSRDIDLLGPWFGR